MFTKELPTDRKDNTYPNAFAILGVYTANYRLRAASAAIDVWKDEDAYNNRFDADGKLQFDPLMTMDYGYSGDAFTAIFGRDGSGASPEKVHDALYADIGPKLEADGWAATAAIVPADAAADSTLP